MKPRTKFLIQIAIIIPVAILLTFLQCEILNSKFDIGLLITNFVLGLIVLFIITIRAYMILKEIVAKRYIPKYKMKIGLDIHGCIDYDPVFFSELSRTLIENGHEVHITTGSFITDELKKELSDYGMKWTHLWSISDHYKNKPGIEYWYDEKGRLWVDDELWNMAKGDYAKSQNLDLLIDDTERYKQYFSNSVAICNIVNKSGKIRPPKAKMPPKPSERNRN